MIYLWVCFGLAGGGAATAFAAATNADKPPAGAPATNADPARGTRAVAVPVAAPIPQSVFVIPKSRGQGVDPFFPLSRRLEVVETGTPTNPPPALVELLIKGFSGTPAAPLIIINDRTFGVGEELEVVTPQGRARVRCLEIRLKDESAIVEANNERRELRFRSNK